MLKWTNEEIDDFCEQAIKLLNNKKQLQLELKNCWVFSNSSGTNLHIVYYNKFLDEESHFFINGYILENEGRMLVDKLAKLEDVDDFKLKIALRIAYFIYRDCMEMMKEKA